MTSSTIAIDLGGTHVRVALVGDNGAVLFRSQQATPQNETVPNFVPELIGLAAAAVDDEHKVQNVVVGIPGIIDHKFETLRWAPNLPVGWAKYLTASWLGERCGFGVNLANDADLAAVGETVYGAAKGFRDVAYVTISTGVGAGVVVDGKIMKSTDSGGELGHTIIDRVAAAKDEPATPESLGSGSAIERRAAAAGLAERGPDLAALVRAGQEPASTIWRTGIEAVGIGIANLALLVAPKMVVIGGGVGLNDDIVLPTIRAQIKKYGPKQVGDIVVTRAKLGDDAALSGAAAWRDALGSRSDAANISPK